MGPGAAGTHDPVRKSESFPVAAELGTLYRTYGALNARDIEAALEEMTLDVEWPNGWEGGTIVGHDAMRDHWSRQWATISIHIAPEGYMILPEGRLRIDVRQTVRDLEGHPLSRMAAHHIYTFRDGKIARMEVG